MRWRLYVLFWCPLNMIIILLILFSSHLPSLPPLSLPTLPPSLSSLPPLSPLLYFGSNTPCKNSNWRSGFWRIRWVMSDTSSGKSITTNSAVALTSVLRRIWEKRGRGEGRGERGRERRERKREGEFCNQNRKTKLMSIKKEDNTCIGQRSNEGRDKKGHHQTRESQGMMT